MPGTLYSLSAETNEDSESLKKTLNEDEFFTPLNAFILMVFVVLYSPCFAAIAIIKAESKIPVVGFYDIHKICKKNKLRTPKKNELVAKIKKAGYKVSETHFAEQGLRSDISLEKLVKLIQ